MPDAQTKGKLRFYARMMRSLIRNGRKNRSLRDFTVKLLENNNVQSKDIDKEIEVIFKFVRDEIKYRKDPYRVEMFQSPVRTLKDYLKGYGAGDCDDKAILAASMLSSIGYKVRLVLMNPRGGAYTHVICEVFHPIEKRWIPLETTLKVPLGWSSHTFKRGIIPI